jgi:hypothetical protein
MFCPLPWLGSLQACWSLLLFCSPLLRLRHLLKISGSHRYIIRQVNCSFLNIHMPSLLILYLVIIKKKGIICQMPYGMETEFIDIFLNFYVVQTKDLDEKKLNIPLPLCSALLFNYTYVCNTAQNPEPHSEMLCSCWSQCCGSGSGGSVIRWSSESLLFIKVLKKFKNKKFHILKF